ncbi:hypothetical protein B0H67DRAFT_558133 [Lasiosphaeris hirsuta]|uniref:Bromo domain-containing protein n=1 Tax=Lasiosphaeris hirsuta TaxID=260670 RepID=A0AA39ZXP5_9PEZI|nr:hypothetical protein B0H67DRAFT_558133 [Lasiosphaeris hirsuta]
MATATAPRSAESSFANAKAQIVAPIHLLQRRDGPLGPWRGGVWGMNTTTPYTPLESLLLFRAIALFGLDAAAFVRISESLQRNELIKADSKYDVARLTPEPLQEHFLNILWDELKTENDSGPRPDGGLSPTSKKRRLQPPPRPTLRDACRHVDKIESMYGKVEHAYKIHIYSEIRHLESQYGERDGVVRKLAAEIKAAEIKAAEIEAAERARRQQEEAKQKNPHAAQGVAAQHEPRAQNGVAPLSTASPKPVSQVPPPLPPQILPRPDTSRNGLPSLQQVVSEKVGPGSGSGPAAPPPPPALAQQQATTSPRLRQQQAAPQRPGVDSKESPKPSNGILPAQPVLQPPQGVPSFQPAPSPVPPPLPAPQPQAAAEGLQRPEGVPRSRQSPIPPPVNPQLVAQGQLKWEPPYQPNTPIPRPPIGVPQQQLPGYSAVQPSQPTPPQRVPPQHVSHPAPRPLQPQSVKPTSQPVLIPPQAAGHYAPPMQSAPARSPVEPVVPSQNQNKPQALAPSPAPNRDPPPTYQQPSQFHGYPQPPPVRSPAVPSLAPTPVTVPPRPSHGLASSPQHRLPAQNLQAPLQYTQLGATSISPTPVLAQSDAQRAYNSPYQLPRAMAPERVQQQRPPSTPVPAPPARITTTMPFAPQTPAMAFPQRRIITGSSTKWESASTPSTPKLAPGSRPWHDEIPPSPAYEALSPILQPAAPARNPSPLAVLPATTPRNATPLAVVAPIPAPREQKKLVRSSEQPVETPPPKRKAGRPRASQRPQDVASPAQSTIPPPSIPPASAPPPAVTPLAVPPAAQPAKVSPRPVIEASPIVEEAPEPVSAKVKDEVTTPRPLTETGDTTADESVTGRRQVTRLAKRKREEPSPSPVQTPVPTPMESDATRLPPASPGHVEEALEPAQSQEVLWTRAFNKVCGSAMEQIIHHRSANMFAAPIRERDAPGYHKVITQPQDLKSIKAAINAGNKAAAQAAAALPGGDPNTSSVWLPSAEALMPPKSIINSGQLDRELAHMFANAIMYNPDAGHGPGPTFMCEDDETQGEGQDSNTLDNGLGYKVDEFGVVNDARNMFGEVDKLLSELRSAEVRRTGGGRHLLGHGLTTGSSTRQASVARGEASISMEWDNHHHNGDEADEQTATEAEASVVGNPVKRRRTTRGHAEG